MAQKIRSDKKVINFSDLATIEALAGLGVPTKKIATIIGMSFQTFYRRMAEMPEIAETIERGKSKDLSHLLAKSKSMAMGESKDPNKSDGDPAMLRWRLAVIHGISKKLDEEEMEETDWDNLTFEELKEKYERLKRRNECTMEILELKKENS